MKIETEVLIIGGGITGASIARELSQYDLEVTVAEKSPDIFTQQTKSSHGFIYSGASLVNAVSLVLKSILDPEADLWEPDSMKIKLANQGHALFAPLAERLEIPYLPLKCLVIARNDEEMEGLKKLYEITDMMGIKDDVRWLSRQEVLNMEPNISPNVKGGLYEEKWANVVFPPDYAIANVDNARDNGVNFLYDAEITGIETQDSKLKFITRTPRHSIASKFIINAAGIYADKVADFANARDDWEIILYRSQMVLLDRRVSTIFKTVNMILGPPQPGFFEGICLQPHGNPYIFCGAYNPIEDKEARETRSEWFKENFEHGMGLVSGFSEKDIITSFTGTRAFNSRDREESIIEFSENQPCFLNVAIRLPGFTFSAAVAKYVVELLGNKGLQLTKKSDYNPFRKAIPRFMQLSGSEKEALIHSDPVYGRVICRCEMVTEGEILEAIKRGATTIQGIQFKTRAGMGRCQRNFCGPCVVEILARELDLPVSKMTKEGVGSEEVMCGSID